MSAEINSEEDKRPVMGTCYEVNGMKCVWHDFKDSWEIQIRKQKGNTLLLDKLEIQIVQQSTLKALQERKYWKVNKNWKGNYQRSINAPMVSSSQCGHSH